MTDKESHNKMEENKKLEENLDKSNEKLHISDVSCSYIDQLGDKILEQRDIDRKWAEDRNIS